MTSAAARIHFTKTLLYNLEVSPAPPAAAPRSLVQEVGLVAGLGAGAGLLLLLAALLILALCRHGGPEQEKVQQQLCIAADLRGGYWVLGTGYWVLATLGTGHTGYWVLGTGYWLRALTSAPAASSPLLHAEDTETPRWASQRCGLQPRLSSSSLASTSRPLLTAQNKSFTSPSLRSGVRTTTVQNSTLHHCTVQRSALQY